MPIDSAQIKKLDQLDKISTYIDEFYIHDSSLIYLDGNSLGRLPKKTSTSEIYMFTQNIHSMHMSLG